MGCARDIGKIIVFQGKRIDFRITGILENLLFSTKNKQTIFRTKTNGKLQQICTKSLKNVKLQETVRMFLFFIRETTKEREVGERGGGQEQQRERREQKSKAGPYTLPNSRSPASGGNYHVSNNDNNDSNDYSTGDNHNNHDENLKLKLYLYW